MEARSTMTGVPPLSVSGFLGSFLFHAATLDDCSLTSAMPRVSASGRLGAKKACSRSDSLRYRGPSPPPPPPKGPQDSLHFFLFLGFPLM